MARPTKSDLLQRITASFKEAGWSVELLSEIGVHPIELNIAQGHKRLAVRAYVWNLTHGGKTRSKDELRIQATGIKSFDRAIGAQTIILGWSQEFHAFACFDIDRHLGALGSSPSLQISRSALESSEASGIAARTKSNSEIVVAVRSDVLAEYVNHRARLHSPAEAQMTVEALRDTLRRNREDRLPELARYAEIAIGGRKAVFGDEAETEERRVILERLATLEREIDQIRQQPGMMGHNRPPPEEALTDPSIAEIADAVRGMGEEMGRDEPRPREIVDRVTVIERVAKVWRSVQNEALKVKDVAKDEIRKRTVGAVITTVAGGGALYHHEVGKIAAQIVDATLNWLSLIF